MFMGVRRFSSCVHVTFPFRALEHGNHGPVANSQRAESPGPARARSYGPSFPSFQGIRLKPEASLNAISSTVDLHASAGTERLSSPMRTASSAEIVSPSNPSSRAPCGPTPCGPTRVQLVTDGVWQYPPTVEPGKQKVASCR
jgi:hypothetical protein